MQVLPAIGHLMIGRSNVDQFNFCFIACSLGAVFSIPVDITLQWISSRAA